MSQAFDDAMKGLLVLERLAIPQLSGMFRAAAEREMEDVRRAVLELEKGQNELAEMNMALMQEADRDTDPIGGAL